MPSTDYDSCEFVVPPAVIEELRVGGFVRSVSKVTVKESADVVTTVLVVYNTAAASTITLSQAPGVIRALAQSLANWFRRGESASHKFELTVRGPRGYMEFVSDQAPDVEVLAKFLRDNVFGEK